ncbi:MAG: acyl transferase [Sphingobacteriia bacterium]|nr:MAG: acyl transferase [Sphingobacteriia bacterium]
MDINSIFQDTHQDFAGLAQQIFVYQYAHNPVYQQWCQLNHFGLDQPFSPLTCPALPLGFFKTHRVYCGESEPEMVFESSRTTGMVPSQHFVKDLSVYEKSFLEGFKAVYGQPSNWCILALLPAYLERSQSSLVYMAQTLIHQSKHPQSGFYLNNFADLDHTIGLLEAAAQPTLLLGVTFALLDFSAAYPRPLKHTRVMETGGMKGRGRELIRQELHDLLCARWGLASIEGEYGMTEMMSQAYALSGGLYQPPPWLKAYVVAEDDPLQVQESGTGLLRFIDLANVHSCSFLQTQDLGRVYPDGRFEVFGRMDHADVRGCSLLFV